MTRRRKRHSREHIIRKLRDADGMLAAGKTIAQFCQALQISERTFHNLLNTTALSCHLATRNCGAVAAFTPRYCGFLAT